MSERSSLRSQRMRDLAPEVDPLRLGIGWSEEDLSKPQVLIESVAGDSMPCSIHLGELVEHVRDGVIEAGGASARYFCNDMCDGVAQGTEAMEYSLASREVIAFATEMHAFAGHFDGVVLLSGSDKALPAHVIAALRLDMPAIMVPGGVMEEGPAGDTLPHQTMSLEQVGTIHAQLQRGEISAREYAFLREEACPSKGTCAFMGTACTMQVLCEAMGLALPGSALRPAASFAMSRGSRQAGKAILGLIEKGITPRQVFTQKALENAIAVHAAIGGSTNAILHLPAFAHEAGLRFDYEAVQRINDRVPFIVNVRPSGRHTPDRLWFAGGVPRVMRELGELIHLDALTVTGRTVGENLEALEKAGWFEQMPRYLAARGLKVEDVVRPVSDPLRPEGAIAILRGNLAPETAVVKRSALDPSLRRFVGRARVFDSQEDALQAIFQDRIQPGDALVIRYEGPAGSGMPEQFYVTEAIVSNPALATKTALVTDGRFSGASRGPAIGHVSPEAAEGGPIAAVQENDLILVDIENRRLDLIGVDGEEKPAVEMERVIAERLERLPRRPLKHTRGLRGFFTHLASSAAEGAVLRLPERPA